MDVDDIKRVAVVGAGTMGHGIAEIVAIAGYDVVMRDVKEEALREGELKIERSLKSLSSKGELDCSPESVLDRIETTVDIERAAADADLVIESVPEHTGLKREIFADLDDLILDDIVLATNTSSLSITGIAAETRSPERIVGLHFFNPPVLMDLVEVIYGKQTPDRTAETAYEFVRSIDKTPMYVRRSSSRSIIAPIIYTGLNEAAWIVTEGDATIEQVDAGMVYQRGYPMGPFELADLIGIDVVYNTLVESGEEVPAILKDKVDNDEFGRKTGGGFYDYESDEGVTYERSDGKNFDCLRIEARMVNRVAKLIGEGVTTADAVDTGLQLGANFPYKLCLHADEIGLDKIYGELRNRFEASGERRYRPAEYLTELVDAGNTGRSAGEGLYGYTDEREYRTLNVSLDDRGVLSIELNRPNRMNAFNETLMDEIKHLLESTDVDEIRCVTFEGAGDQSFSTGADLNSFSDVASYQAAEVTSMFDTVDEFPRPTIAKINGFCLGGGLELALSCDLRIATQDSQLGFPEINHGLLPGSGSGTQRALENIGEARAKELVFRGHHISAERAEDWGLINRAVEPEKLDDVSEEFISDLLGGSPMALRFAKKVLNRVNNSNTAAALAMETQGYGLLMSENDPVDRTSPLSGGTNGETEDE